MYRNTFDLAPPEVLLSQQQRYNGSFIHTDPEQAVSHLAPLQTANFPWRRYGHL